MYTQPLYTAEGPIVGARRELSPGLVSGQGSTMGSWAPASLVTGALSSPPAQTVTIGTTPLNSPSPWASSPVVNVPTTPLVVKDHVYGATDRLPTESMLGTQVEVRATVAKRCVCECLGTLVLFLVVALCTKTLYIAAFYAALVYTFWFISGSHFNPAISFALALAGHMPLRSCLFYIVSQIVGALFGGLLCRFVFTTEVAVTPVSPYTLADVAHLEVLYTAMLTFVALNIICSHRNEFFGIAIGFVILAGGFVTQKISTDALFNPALALGVMVSSVKIGTCFWYMLWELVGAIIGFLLFRICRFYESTVGNYQIHELEYGYGPHLVETDYLQTRVLWTRMFSEFCGTFFLVTTVCLNVALSTGQGTLSAGGALISMIYALAGACDGHFNPAMSVAVMLSGRKCSAKECRAYIFAQLLAAILAGLVAGKSVCSGDPTKCDTAGLFMASSSYSWFQIGFVETFFTFILVYVALVVATSEKHTSPSKAWPNAYYALAIGLAFIGSSYAARDISGGYLNPAAAFGFAVDGQPSISSATSVTGWAQFIDAGVVWFLNALEYYVKVLYYWIPEFLGAALAALVFKFSHVNESAKAYYEYLY